MHLHTIFLPYCTAAKRTQLALASGQGPGDDEEAGRKRLSRRQSSGALGGTNNKQGSSNIDLVLGAAAKEAENEQEENTLREHLDLERIAPPVVFA